MAADAGAGKIPRPSPMMAKMTQGVKQRRSRCVAELLRDFGARPTLPFPRRSSCLLSPSYRERCGRTKQPPTVAKQSEEHGAVDLQRGNTALHGAWLGGQKQATMTPRWTGVVTLSKTRWAPASYPCWGN